MRELTAGLAPRQRLLSFMLRSLTSTIVLGLTAKMPRLGENTRRLETLVDAPREGCPGLWHGGHEASASGISTTSAPLFTVSPSRFILLPTLPSFQLLLSFITFVTKAQDVSLHSFCCGSARSVRKRVHRHPDSSPFHGEEHRSHCLPWRV